MQKISVTDYARLATKETNDICDVKEGDLVALYSSDDKRKKIIGIVVQLFDDKMCLMTGKTMKEWWSRYVKCEVIGYNK